MLLAVSILAAAGPLAAQSPAPQAPAPAATPAPAAPSSAQPAERPAEAPRPLILRLDDVDAPRMSFGRSAGEKDAPRNLPSLGEDVRTPESRMRSSPYPHSSDNLQ
jgi:2-oxoglutarate dehydrogenase E2 component (dihydrolipoamide succinyltransferase)